jgi:transcriptional regulator with XRE-family HTH domain
MRQFASPAVSDATTSVEQWQRGDRSEGLRRAMLSVLIRDLRLSQNMNRAELAEITEIPRERIFALEHGTLPLNQLSIGDIGALAGALGPDSRKLLLWVSGRALAPGPCGPQPRHLRASRKPLPNLFGRICD